MTTSNPVLLGRETVDNKDPLFESDQDGQTTGRSSMNSGHTSSRLGRFSMRKYDLRKTMTADTVVRLIKIDDWGAYLREVVMGEVLKTLLIGLLYAIPGVLIQFCLSQTTLDMPTFANEKDELLGLASNMMTPSGDGLLKNGSPARFYINTLGYILWAELGYFVIYNGLALAFLESYGKKFLLTNRLLYLLPLGWVTSALFETMLLAQGANSVANGNFFMFVSCLAVVMVIANTVICRATATWDGFKLGMLFAGGVFYGSLNYLLLPNIAGKDTVCLAARIIMFFLFELILGPWARYSIRFSHSIKKEHRFAMWIFYDAPRVYLGRMVMLQITDTTIYTITNTMAELLAILLTIYGPKWDTFMYKLFRREAALAEMRERTDNIKYMRAQFYIFANVMEVICIFVAAGSLLGLSKHRHVFGIFSPECGAMAPSFGNIAKQVAIGLGLEFLSDMTASRFLSRALPFHDVLKTFYTRPLSTLFLVNMSVFLALPTFTGLYIKYYQCPGGYSSVCECSGTSFLGDVCGCCQPSATALATLASTYGITSWTPAPYKACAL